MGKEELRILMLEDVASDAEIIERELRKRGIVFSARRVETEEAFLKELEDFAPDIILADYKLPSFDGITALAIKQKQYPDVPFILVSGAMGEEFAIETLKMGATDYVLKHNLSRLVPSVNRALREVEDQAERKKAEKAQQELDKKYRDLVDNALVGVYETNLKGDILYVNDALTKILEFRSREEMMAESALALDKNPKDRDVLIEDLKKMGRVGGFETELITKTKKIKNVLLSAALEGDIISGMIIDITDRKQAEKQIRRQLDRLSALHDIDIAISASLDIRVTLEVFLPHVIAQLGVDAAAVLLLNPYTQTLEYAAGHGFRSRAIEQMRVKLGVGHAGRAALERQTVNISNVIKSQDMCVRVQMLKDDEFFSHRVTPLIAKGQVKGVLEVFHRAPLDPDQEWLDFFESLAAQAAIAIDNASLFNDLQRSNVELVLAYDATIEGWSRALDLRDKETEGHSQRVVDMTIKIARTMGVNETELVHVRRGTLLHDIGKMGILDSILLKPDPLTEEEWEVMRKHPIFAYELLSPIAFLRPAIDIPYYHHEKWNGTGYPRGLKEEQIPLSARIFAVVDVWDALHSERPYRPAWPEEKIWEYIREQAGKHFDPKVVEVFLKLFSEQKP